MHIDRCLNIELEEKTFKCDLCGYMSKDKIDFYKHSKTKCPLSQSWAWPWILNICFMYIKYVNLIMFIWKPTANLGYISSYKNLIDNYFLSKPQKPT